MPEPVDRMPLLPSLLDRLTDEGPAIEAELHRVRERLRELKARAKGEGGGIAGEELRLAERITRTEQKLDELERLRDFEAQATRSVSLAQLRRSVLRDLGWLFNTTSLESTQPLNDYPLAARSVINFGLPDLAGQTVSGISTDLLERAIQEAIAIFEPRILTRTLSVRMRPVNPDAHHNAIVFEIRGELRAEPNPVPLYLTTEVNLEDGDARVSEPSVGDRR